MKLETDRLIIRPLDEFDVQSLFPIMNDPEVTANLLIPHPYPEDRVLMWIRNSREAMDAAERYDLGIVPKDIDRAIGICSLCHVSWEHLSAELVYWIGKPYWGRGYITEAARKVLEFGFMDLGLERIRVGCFTRNKASARVIEKLGFEYEGLARSEYRKGNERFDTLHYSIIREEFAAKP